MISIYLYIISVIGLLVCFVMIELFLIKKSIQAIRASRQAYIELKKSKDDLSKYLK